MECCGKRVCIRHALLKTSEQVEFCKKDEGFRAYLDSTADSRREGKVGDKLASVLSVAGITPEWYSAAKEAIGLPPTCSCPERKRWINSLHAIATQIAAASSKPTS